MWNEGTSSYNNKQGQNRSAKHSYADVVRREYSQRDKSLAQSSETSKPHRTGWDDEIYDFSGSMPDDGASERFYQGIKDIKGKAIDDILALIPAYAIGQDISNSSLGHERQGFQYTWTDPQNNNWRVYAHSPDGNYILRGWTVRVQRNYWYMDSSGNFHPAKVAQKDGDNADACIINDTHIPFKTPDPYICPITNPNPQFPWGKAQLARIEELLQGTKR